MATLVLPACWVPAGDTGETFWQGTPRSNSLLQKLGGQKFFGALGQVPTKWWLPHYTYDASEPNLWSPTADNRNANTLQLLEHSKFFGALGQVPTKWWAQSYNYDVGESNLWSPALDNRCSNTLQLLDHQKFFGAPGQVPTTEWSPYVNYDAAEPIWFAKATAANEKLLSPAGATSFFSPLWVPDVDVGETFWVGKSVARSPNLSVVTFAASPFWIPDPENGESSWLAKAVARPRTLVSATTPFTPPPWKFGYFDDSFWIGKPLSSSGAFNLGVVPFAGAFWIPDSDVGETFWSARPMAKAQALASTTPIAAPPWKFGYFEDSFWSPASYNFNSDVIALLTEQKFFGAGGQAPTKLWRYDYDAGESFWLGHPVSKTIPAVGTPFIPPPWQFRYDADSFWQGAPLNADPIVFLTAQKFFGAGGQAPAKLWRYDYNVGESFWQGGNPSAADPILLLTEQKFYGAGGQAPTKLWRYDHDVGESFWVGRPTPKGPQLVVTSSTSFFSPLWVPDVDVGETFWVGKSTTHSPGLTTVSFAASPFWIPDPENAETFWTGKSVAKIQSLNIPTATPFNSYYASIYRSAEVGETFWVGSSRSSKFSLEPFAGALWIPDVDVGETFWIGKPTAKIEVLVVAATTPFVNFPLGARPSEDGSWSLVVGYNQSLTGSLVIARGSFYSPRPGDVPDWVGVPTAKPEALVPPAARTTPFANYPFISRLVDDPTWYGSPTSNQTLALPTTVARAAFFYPKPSFDQDWQYVGRVNLQAYTPGPPIPPPAAYAFFSPLWVPDIDTGEAFWQGRPLAKIQGLVPGQQFAASPLWIPDSDVGESFWLGHALASSLSIRTVTKEPFIYLPWKFGQDDASYWVGAPSGSQTLVRTVTKEPFIYVPWKFGQDDASGWQSGSKTKNPNLNNEPFVNLPWQWKFNYDDPSSWQGKSTASQLIVPTLATKPFIYVPWKFGQDDASGWQYGPRARNPNLVTIVEPFANPPFRFGYDDSSGWQFYSRSSRLLVPTLTAAGQVRSKQWLFGHDDPAFWQVALSRQMQLLVLPPAKPSIIPATWRYNTDEAAYWSYGYLWRFPGTFPTTPLVVDPRFIVSPNALVLSNFGAARTFIVSPGLVTRTFVVSPNEAFPGNEGAARIIIVSPTKH